MLDLHGCGADVALFLDKGLQHTHLDSFQMIEGFIDERY